MNAKDFIKELVEKECERYDLIAGGFITGSDEVTEVLLQALPDFTGVENAESAFIRWKETFCRDFYTQLDYAGFLRAAKNDKSYFRPLVKRLIRNILYDLRRKHTSVTIDEELKTEFPRTLAYQLSVPLFSSLYAVLADKRNLFVTPVQVEERCGQLARENFPLDFSALVDRLKKKDREFWNEIFAIIRRLAYGVLQSKFLTSDRRDEIAGEVSLESGTLLQRQLDDDELNHIQSAGYLRNYLRKVCFNKMQEYFKSSDKFSKEELLGEEEWKAVDCISVEDEPSGNIDLYDVDVTNKKELVAAIFSLLLGPDCRERQLLVGKDENKCRIFLMQIHQQMKYEDMACTLYGEMDGDQLKKTIVTLRQIVSRTRKVLIKRMVWLTGYLKGDKTMLNKLTVNS